MTISKAKLQEISAELTPFIEEVLKRHGLSDPKMQWKYGTHLELKMSASLLDEGPQGINLASEQAQYYARFGYHGLTADLGTVFEHKGMRYAFAGIAARRPKYPLYAKNLSTGDYHFFPEQAIALINSAAAKASV